MRVLIVDDEPLARRGVRARLVAMPDVEIAGEADSGLKAVSEIERLRPDVVLLDVQMPELDGFGVIDAIGVDRMPVTIFLTAYDTHAVRAFDANALDYLLKPIDDERFRLAMTRARTRLAEHTTRPHSQQLAAALAAAAEQRIVLRDGSRVLLFDQQDIDWLGADGDYVRVHAKGRSYLVRHTMASMEARLDPKRFARVHRSAIVNATRVARAETLGHGEYRLQLSSGAQVDTSRAYSARVHELLHA
jgi:two-component system LytT family response regulator